MMDSPTETGQSHAIANYEECACAVDWTTELGQSQVVVTMKNVYVVDCPTEFGKPQVGGNYEDSVCGGLPY